MKSFFSNEKGIAMVMAITMIILAVILANVVMTIMLSHGSLTQHQIARIQAYYAGMAGINLALDRLIENDATWLAGGTHTICNNCAVAGAIQDNQFPPAIQRIEVNVRLLLQAEGAIPAGSREITATIFYQNPTS